jgi:hypothetical protein
MNTERGHALFPDRLLSSIVLIPYQSDCQEEAKRAIAVCGRVSHFGPVAAKDDWVDVAIGHSRALLAAGTKSDYI